MISMSNEEQRKKDLEKWKKWADGWDPPKNNPSRPDSTFEEWREKGVTENFIEWAEKLINKRAEGMTEYFMQELEGILPSDQHESVRRKLLEKFKGYSLQQVAKKWVEEMTGKNLDSKAAS